MARSTSKRPRKVTGLAPEKGSELVGIVVLILALLLGASLVTFHPEDSSFLHRVTGGGEIRNLIGPLGSEVAAAAFGFVGLTSLVVPALLLVAAWRRLRPRPQPKVVGRGLGAVLLVVALPGLLQLTLESLLWRGTEISAGGLLGEAAANSLQQGVGFTGSLLVLLGAVIIGSTLLVQSTLGEILAVWTRRLSAWKERWGFAWTRRQQRVRKDKARRRVVAKHLERAAEKRAQQPAPEEHLDLPLRVTEKSGDKPFAVRRVTAQKADKGTPRPKPSGRPQRTIEFPKGAKGKGTLPPINLLQVEAFSSKIDENLLVRQGEAIRSRCAEFGVDGSIEGIAPGPVITVYEFQPAPGVKVSQIVNLQDDLALALKAESVRIDRIPGRSTLGIEVPNDDRAVIQLGNLLSRGEFRRSHSPLTMALGTDIRGEPYVSDLASMPHLLVAGATGSGKSVGLQSMITSIVYKATREEVQFIFIDPKRIELGVYADIPHLKAEVVVEPKKAANALRWAVAEMERRYRLLAEAHVRSIDYYNRAIQDPKVQQRLALSDGDVEIDQTDLKPLPYYVVVIDELADLMMVASGEVEASIARLAQMARAVGIHLIVATQRPSVDVLTGTIKANFPCRISYATASRHDSRTILDQVGAEKLLGRGDMLFMPPGTSRVLRLHGAYVSEQETAALVRWLKRVGPPELDPAVLQAPEEERGSRRWRRQRRRPVRRGRAPGGRRATGLGQLPAAPPQGRLLARRTADRHHGARRAAGPAPGQQATRRAGQARLLHRARRGQTRDRAHLRRLAFFGTPAFAVPTLRALCGAGRPPLVVVSQPSRAAGRGRKSRQPPVAEAANELGLEIWQPRSIRRSAFRERLAELELDLAVVVAYGKIFPVPLLETPRYGCVNVHASLLPKYRGAAPIHAAIAAGETTTGVTTMQMEEGLDSGPILLRRETSIGPEETTPELSARLAVLGAELLVETVEALERGDVEPRGQDEAAASLAPMLSKEDGLVDWELDAATLANRLRAYTPWPGLTASLAGEPVKIVAARPLTVPADAPGTILGMVGERLAVACGGGSVLGIGALQRPGRRALAAADFVNGERLGPGDRFDSTPAS